MRIIPFAAILAVALCAAGTASADDTYNTVPAGDAVYAQCKTTALKRYDGGTDASPIAGQNKVEAFCTCMWNETPDNFRGNLATFSETPRGAAANKTCEKYSNWSD
jgi:hypothetical protein